MTTRQEILVLVIEPLNLLARPNVDPINSPAEYARMVNLYVETLKDFDPETIRRGMLLFQRDWTGSKWPVPGKLHQFFVEAQTEERQANPRPALPSQDLPTVPREERERVGDQLTLWRTLMQSGEFWKMNHEEAYDAVYLEEPWPGHKQERLANIARQTNDR